MDHKPHQIQPVATTGIRCSAGKWASRKHQTGPKGGEKSHPVTVAEDVPLQMTLILIVALQLPALLSLGRPS